MQVWTCFGATNPKDASLPLDRQLTTMSASYAPMTMPAYVPEGSFQNVQVPMGQFGEITPLNTLMGTPPYAAETGIA